MENKIKKTRTNESLPDQESHMPRGPLAYLGAPDATTGVRGIVELATVAETVTGTDTTKAVTAAGVAAVAIAGAPDASTTQKGIIEIATNGEAAAKVATNLALVPSNIPSIMASPGDIGASTPGAGTFTTLTMTDLVLTNPLGVAEGGTNISSYTTGDMLYASGATTLSKRAIGSARQLLQTNAGATAPEWTSNIDVPGTLDVTGAVVLDDALSVTGTTTCSGLLTCNASANIKTGGTTLGLGSDNDTAAVNLGIGSSARTITIGGSGANTLNIAHTQTGGSVVVGDAMTTGTVTIGGATNTGILTLGASTAAGGQTINVASAINTGTQVVNIAAGAAGATSTVNILSGNATAGTQTLNLGTGNRAKAINIGNGIDGNTIAIGNGVNTTAQTVNISNGASGANTTVNIMSGTGTAGAGTLALGNNPRVTVAGLADVAPAASRTVTVGGGTVVVAATIDTIDIGPDGATTNADSVKTVNINTGTVATGQVLTNIASGTVTSGTHTTSIASGNRAAGTMAVNLLTGTGTKSLAAGNADGSTTFGFKGVMNVNASQNSNTNINTGTSTGAVAIGNSLAGAITADSSAGISLDAVTASNFTVTGTADLTLASVGGSVVINGTEAVADAIYLNASDAAGGVKINAGTGKCTVNSNLALATAATQLQVEGGAATDFIGTGVLTAGTVTINNTNIAATDRIFLSRTAVNASTTLGELTYTISAGASFAVTSVILGTPGSTQTGDVSSFAYFIVRQL